METQPGKIEEREFITKAAIQLPDGKILTGKQHSKMLEEFFEELDTPGEKKEGFITNTGRFVSRLEAGEIAFKAGQIEKITYRLQSQDLNLE